MTTASRKACHPKGKIPGEDDYYWAYTDEPHVSRRKQILAKYPQIKALYGYDPNVKYITTLLVSIQITLAYYTQFVSGRVAALTACCVGSLLNHALLFALHECAHNLAFPYMYHNRYFAFFANLPIGFPTATSFRRYHLDHHKFQGEDGVDVGTPTEWEARIFQGKLMKFIYCIFQMFFYGLRPDFVNPKKWTKWEYANLACCATFNTVLWIAWSPWSVIYLILSSVSTSIWSAHLIAEHTAFVAGTETYSYYGPLNRFNFNAGYHTEHHDFPNVPGSRLAKIREIATEFYDDLPCHHSYIKVFYDFIMDDNISLYHRVKRHRLSEEERGVVQAR